MTSLEESLKPLIEVSGTPEININLSPYYRTCVTVLEGNKVAISISSLENSSILCIFCTKEVAIKMANEILASCTKPKK